MEFLYFLEKLRVPVVNEFMLAITRMGEETAFLAVALILFWCVDKRRGYYVMTVGFIGTMVNHFLKLMCRVPRPWVLDPEFTILEQAREAATGYSFPSGHTQNAVGTFGAIALTGKHKWTKLLSIALTILVPFSRMYIGVHTPADVLASTVIALGLIFLLKPVAMQEDGRGIQKLVIFMLLLSVGLLAFVSLYPFPEDMDLRNLESGMKNVYTMLGCMLGVFVVYGTERKYVNFETKAIWWIQLLKAGLGLSLVLQVKEGLRAPLEAVMSPYPARAVRYFLVVVVAGLLWPMTFRWFQKLGETK